MPVKSIVTTQENYDYGIDSSLISVLIKLRDKIGKEVIDLIDSNFDLLPKKSANIQVVAGQVQRNTPYYFALAYLNEPDSYASFMSIEEISQDEYFDLWQRTKYSLKLKYYEKSNPISIPYTINY